MIQSQMGEKLVAALDWALVNLPHHVLPGRHLSVVVRTLMVSSTQDTPKTSVVRAELSRGSPTWASGWCACLQPTDGSNELTSTKRQKTGVARFQESAVGAAPW